MPNKKRYILPEDLYDLKHAVTPRISPDGKNVIYVQSRVDKKTEKKYANLWIAPTSRNSPWQFTYGNHNDSSPEWSPDGKQIAFLSNRDSAELPPQVYLIPIDGGEARPLTNIKGRIMDFSWSPDGSRLLCTVVKADAEVLQRLGDENKKKLGVVSRHYDRLFYKFDGFGYLPKEQAHIWTIDTKTGKGNQLTDHDLYREMSPTWSPDGKTIAFVSNRSESPDHNPDLVTLFTMPADGGEFTEISTPVGQKGGPSYSPDGKWIAYIGKEGESHWYRNTSLWVVPADGTAPSVNLTEQYDIHVSASIANDVGGTEQMPPIWSNDSTTLYFQVDKNGETGLYSIATDGSKLTQLAGKFSSINSVTFDKSQTRIAYFKSTMVDPGSIWTMSLNSGYEKKISKQNDPLLSKKDLGEFEEIWFKGPDDNDLQGWIIKPPNFDPAKKYPSILEIHGGPLTQYGHHFMHEFFTLAAKGYVVYFCNPRGGQGYGEAHAKAIWGGWGDADYADLMAFTDLVEALPYIDPDCMGVTGGSYGGYMTLWIIGHTNRFKSAVAQRVVSNLISMWGSSDMNWVFQQILGDKAPFENIDKFWQHSPMKYIGNATTPTLIIHSEMDMRCPIEQGEQAYVALKRLGVDTEMVRFPDEPHGVSRSGRTDRRVVRLNHIIRWFDKYL